MNFVSAVSAAVFHQPHHLSSDNVKHFRCTKHETPVTKAPTDAKASF